MTSRGEAIVPRRKLASVEPSPSRRVVEYPARDGRPMGETDQHIEEARDYVVDVLRAHFARDPRVYVSGNNFVYWTEGVPTDCLSPDAYVVKGVKKKLRDTFKVWKEGRKPCFVLEVTSRSTRHEDLGDKMAKYRDDLGVPEYFLFDPRAEWIPERLRGYTLEDGVYQPLRPNERGRLESHALGLELGVEGEHVRFYVPGEKLPLPTDAEEVHRLRAEVARLTKRRRRRSP